MSARPVYKSDEGRRKIHDHYNSLLHNLEQEFQEVTVKTSFGDTHLIEAGNLNGPVVVLLHGSCSNSAMWFGDLPSLSKSYRVLALDIIGEAGKSDEIRLDLKSSAYADWIQEVLEKMGVHCVSIIGNSFGGWLALKYAAEYPSHVNALALIAPSGLVPARSSFVFRSVLCAMQGAKGMDKLTRLVYGHSDVPEVALKTAKLTFEYFNPMVGSLPILSDEELHRLTMDVLYIAGDQDATTDTLKASQRLKTCVPKASIVLKQNHGHVVIDEIARIVSFLSS